MEADLGFIDFSVKVIIPRLLEGMIITVKLSLLSGLCGMLLGMVIAFLKISRNKFISSIATVYITIFRGTPLLLQILFIYFALPTLVEITLDSFWAGILALSLNAAAYGLANDVAEIGDVASIFMCIADDNCKPMMHAWRKMPAVEGWHDYELRQDKFQTVSKFGYGGQRTDTIGVIWTAPTRG